MKKRSAPEEIEPVVLGNIRFEALLWGKNRGLGQNGGLVTAIDQRTNEELWVAYLYEIKYDPNMEEDKQDIFLISLEVDSTANRLLAEDERGRRYALDLFSRKATEI